MRRTTTVFLCGLLLATGCKHFSEQTVCSADVIVYGGTSAGVVAAVQAARLGKSVILVSPDKHLGGLSSGGLGWTDSGKADSIGGMSREFYQRIYTYYAQPGAWRQETMDAFRHIKGQGTKARNDKDQTQWLFEPHVAEQVFEAWLRESKVELYRSTWLDRTSGLSKQGAQIQSFRTLDGRCFAAKVFIDATYEGDLMAAAGVRYHVGREANAVYQEAHNGVQLEHYNHHAHYFKANVSPYRTPGDPASGLLPNVSAEPPGKTGEGDHRVQAYCFRVCMTCDSQNRIPFPKPENYDPLNYELMVRELVASGRLDFFEKFDLIPNKKTDTNNHGAFSSDYIGANYAYPEASYELRRQIIRAHENYQKGLLYFASTDPRMPAYIREKIAQWGLPKDEFTDNGGWPHQLYIREARRMIGAYVMTENDVLHKREVPQPIGMGSYTLDSHHVQRYITAAGWVQNEGDIGVSTKGPYRIAYGAITPQVKECTNLLVPVAMSSSHIAYGSIRMEPVFMILGQSAAVAAAQAIDTQQAVQAIDYPTLDATLKKLGQRY